MLDKMDIGPIRRHILKYNKPSHHQLSRAAASPAGRILAFMDKYEENQTKPKYEISTWSLVFGEEVSVVKRPNKMKYAVGEYGYTFKYKNKLQLSSRKSGNLI